MENKAYLFAKLAHKVGINAAEKECNVKGDQDSQKVTWKFDDNSKAIMFWYALGRFVIT